jgi:alpha-1,6-mannosyl-glycoprotein beta-1,2-N-acetylglucosaminyltransferase
VEVTEWVSSKHNMGMAFTREQWGRILGCSDLFCRYDDYNWDWSLQHISNHCFKQKLQVTHNIETKCKFHCR